MPCACDSVCTHTQCSDSSLSCLPVPVTCNCPVWSGSLDQPVVLCPSSVAVQLKTLSWICETLLCRGNRILPADGSLPGPVARSWDQMTRPRTPSPGCGQEDVQTRVVEQFRWSQCRLQQPVRFFPRQSVTLTSATEFSCYPPGAMHLCHAVSASVPWTPVRSCQQLPNPACPQLARRQNAGAKRMRGCGGDQGSLCCHACCHDVAKLSCTHILYVRPECRPDPSQVIWSQLVLMQ